MKQSLTPELARVFKRLHYPFDVMLMWVRWYVAYGLSVRNLDRRRKAQDFPLLF